MDNDCLRLQNHKSEVPIATEQLARLPIIIIINHADFTVFSGTAGDCTGQGAAGASGPAKQAGKGRVARRRVGEEESGWREGTGWRIRREQKVKSDQTSYKLFSSSCFFLETQKNDSIS